jgi:hypothetical protein
MGLNVLAASPSNKDGDRAMNEEDHREQLERKLAQTRRLAAQASDLTTKERLAEVAVIAKASRVAPPSPTILRTEDGAIGPSCLTPRHTPRLAQNRG